MISFLKSLGPVCGIPLFITFEISIFTTFFLTIFVFLNYRKIRRDAKSGVSNFDTFSEENLFFLTHQQIPWLPLRILEVTPTISTSLGLLGTVLGLFQLLMTINLSAAGPEKISVIIRSYGTALSTTVAGLTIAIMATLALIALKTKFLLIALEATKNEQRQQTDTND